MFPQHLDGMGIGQSIDFRGPNDGLLTYRGRGVFAVKKDKKSAPDLRRVRRVSMIAGGSGITPMLQVITAVLNDPADATEMALLYANRTEGDILVRPELEAYRREHPHRFRVWYTLSSLTDGKGNWDYRDHTKKSGPQVAGILLEWQGRSGKQEQKQNAPHLGPILLPTPEQLGSGERRHD